MAALFVSFVAAAQTTDSEGRIIIDSAEEFLKIGNRSGYPIDTNSSYIQTADINLGNMGTLDTAIIKEFRGTYDGGGHSISYSATFRGKSHKDENSGVGYGCDHGNGNGNYDGDYGLFGFLRGGVEHGGVIKNLNLSGDILVTRYPNNNCNSMNYALLCGHAFCGSTIDHCNVTGTVSSQVEGQKGGGDAGLLIGQADGATIQYCTGSGNVSSIGWVGGLIGSGGHNDSITIKACTFSGSVQASRAKSNTAKPEELEEGYGGFAGGIIGFAGKHGLNNWQSVEPSVSIDLCYVNANITATNVVSGIASVAMGAGTATVKNSCAEGSITKTELKGEIDTVTNSSIKSNLHNSTDKPVDDLERIVEALNREIAPEETAEFDVVDGKIVLYLDGKPAEPCAAVTGLTISNVAPGSLTCSWAAGGSETKWIVSISGGGLTEDITKNVTTNQDVTITDDSLTTVTITDNRLTTSQSNYVLSVVADCEGDGPNSTPTTSSFVISCPTITGMSVTPDYTSATVAWTNTETVKAELFQGGNPVPVKEQVIPSEQPHTYTFDTLTPNTTYKVRLSAACGGGVYGEATERVFTTKSLPIVENVQIAARFEDGGSVNIAWDYALDGATYQVEVQTSAGGSVDNQSGLDTRNYTKSSIEVGSYQASIKATYQGHEAGWTEWFPFVISNPNAPKNVHWSDTAIVNSQYQLTLAWIKGNDGEIQGNSGQGWEITADPNSGAAYTITANSGTSNYSKVLSNDNHYVTPGSSQTFYIREWTQQENNYYYSSWFPITFVAPCFEIEAPTAGAITQTSATLSGLRSGYEVVLSDGTNTTNYPASGETLSETLSLTGLTPATHYTAEVRSYCNREQGKYSSKTVEFTTVGCYSPTNVTVTDITSTSAKVSWTQGNPTLSGLQFRYVLEKKTGETYTQVQTADGYVETAKTFTNLEPATLYRVSIAEQCGTAYGTPTTITFTTSSPGNFVAINTGGWSSTATWQDGRIPDGLGTITINDGVTVTLGQTLVLTDSYTLTNNGTLLINNGELVNTTTNNDLGKVKIAFNSTEQGKWSFVGVPFAQNYRLETIAPYEGSDVAVVLYDYPNGRWSNDWATINNIVPVAEGFFLWPFYYGAIIFNNDYNTDGTPDYTLSNSDIMVKRNVVNSSSGNWMALANPYPAKLNIAKFWQDNSSNLQGNVVYKYNTAAKQFEIKDCNNTDLFVALCEGFFVNFQSAGNDKSVVFHKTQMTSYPSGNNTKSKTAQNPWIEMSLVNKIDKVKFFFVRNPLAEQGYDKYDANKLFATTGVAEPYFVTDGMNLVKEEVKELPYYATLNVRSEQDTLMTFVADKIPEGYRVSLIDGEQTIEMNEGSRYETNISAGENADRFKLLIQNNVGLNQVPQTDITITNSNRHVAISAEAISNVEVFNALGQRVYQTKASTFTLSGVQSGVYVVRVSTAKGTKSQKIVVE